MLQLTGLEGKVAIVTGAGRMQGIGRGIAKAFGRAGCTVLVHGTGRPLTSQPAEEIAAGWRDIESVVAEIVEAGGKASGVVGDITDPAGVESIVATALTRYGRLDFLVNNAGAARAGDRVPVAEMPLEEWTRVHKVNVTGTFLMSGAVARALLKQNEGGAIVNISSIAGKIFYPKTAAYSSSKAAVQAMTGSLARELGPAGIRVNTICPGMIDNHRMASVRGTPLWDTYVANIALGRLGKIDEMGFLAAFLCSAEGSYIHGQSINIDGGWVMEH